jgi:hypothetical protein
MYRNQIEILEQDSRRGQYISGMMDDSTSGSGQEGRRLRVQAAIQLFKHPILILVSSLPSSIPIATCHTPRQFFS